MDWSELSHQPTIHINTVKLRSVIYLLLDKFWTHQHLSLHRAHSQHQLELCGAHEFTQEIKSVMHMSLLSI